MANNIYNQDGHFISVICPSPTNVRARIFSEDQRKAIKNLIHHNFMPKKTTVGEGRCTRKHWNVEKYRGRHGVGFRMITSSPYSSNFNHITYFIKYL